jgi:GMP synthase PP-ATPase subunit
LGDAPWHIPTHHVARRVANEARGVSRVVYDVAGKAQVTIEWK